MRNTNWWAVGLYFLMACAFSWPFFWWRDIHPESWNALEIHRYFKTWLVMWGPGVASLICLFIFRRTHQRVMTFQGTSLKHGILFYLILILAISIVHQDARLLGLGVVGFISILGEELGWRGFLQDALQLKSDVIIALVMGIMWETWRFTAHTTSSGAVIRVSLFLLITSDFSWVTIRLTKTTRSLFIPITLHMALNAAFEFEKGVWAVLLCVPVWVLIFLNWQKILKTI